MFDIDTSPLQAISVEYVLLVGFVLWAVYSQVFIPLRNAHTKRELRVTDIISRIHITEKRLKNKVHKQDFAALESKVNDDITILKRMEAKLDSFISAINLINQAFEGRITRLEERKDVHDKR